MKIDLHKFSEIAINAAKLAGDYLISQKLHEKKILSESARDIKLEIDLTTENIIKDALSSTKINVLGEETGYQAIGSSDYYWVIDPLDGTSNYFRGLPACCVCIALMKNEVCLIGIINEFNQHNIYSSFKDNGAYLNGEQIFVSEIQDKTKATLSTGIPSSKDLAISSKYIKSLEPWQKVRMFGSAGLSCAYVASGRCDVYLEKGVYLWDFAAGICLVEEAGGKATFKKIDDSRYLVNFTNGKL